jgi:hypothetical protein
MSQTKISVLQVCDHLGWAGSRMHGVKRLFAWMIPRFDASRFDVSLVSLRKRDSSEDTLEQLGIDVTYLHKSKFDPATLTALLKVMDRKHTDLLHLHGYGATTFGPELFPTSSRGSANGGLNLAAVAGAVVGLLLAGTLTGALGSLPPAMALLSIGPAVVVLLIIAAYPETAHRELEDLNPTDAPLDAPPPADH